MEEDAAEDKEGPVDQHWPVVHQGMEAAENRVDEDELMQVEALDARQN
jgi:hypothetical protein